MSRRAFYADILLLRCVVNRHNTHSEELLKYRRRMAIFNCGELRESRCIIVVEILWNLRKLWRELKISGLKNLFGYCEHCTAIMLLCTQWLIRLSKEIRKIIHRPLARTLNSVSFNLTGFVDLYFYHSNRITKFYWDYFNTRTLRLALFRTKTNK